MDRRTIMATAATLHFLLTQPGEFTPLEIYEQAPGLHCDNDEDDIETVCNGLVAMGYADRVIDGDYRAFRRARPEGAGEKPPAPMPEVPADFPVRPLGPDDPATDRVTCGTCGRSWDDAIGTTWTPAPAARCPFEYFHPE